MQSSAEVPGASVPNLPGPAPEAPPMPPPVPPLSPPSRRPRRSWIAIAAGIVVAVVLVAGLFVAGIGPFARPGGSEVVSSGQTYRQALSVAGNSASSYGSGPWSVLVAAGIDSPSPVAQSTVVPSNLFSVPGSPSTCLGAVEGGGATSVTFPGFDGNLSTGEAPAWLFILIGGSGTILVATVTNGAATVWEKFSGSGCAIFELIGTLSSGIVDSPTAVSAALSAGGYSFIHAHPGGSLSYAATELLGPGAWFVSYSTCPVSGTATAGSTYYAFNATVSLSTGAIVGTPVGGRVGACPSLNLTGGLLGGGPGGAQPTPLHSVLSIEPVAAETHGSSYGYAVNVTRAPSGMVWGNLEFTVLTRSGAAAAGPYAVEVYTTAGCAVAIGALNDPIYLAPITGYCPTGLSGSQAPVAVGETLSISSTSSLVGTGDTLVVMGQSPYSGNVTAAIP